ncbi:MAG: caspase family protein, partial [Clostridiales bacterium]|nr:caspase family protein [Clostridiales bacterium]
MKGKRIILWMLICIMLLLVWPAADASAAEPELRGLSIGYGDDDIVGDGLEGTYYNNADLAADLFTQAGFDRVEKRMAPTADELLLALEGVFGNSSESDRHYIYISVPCDTLNGRDSVLVLPDGTGYGTDVLLAEDFYRALMDLPGRFTVILDCNYAGGFLPTPLAVPGENSISIVDGNETAAESPEEKITVLYSTASDEVMAVAEDADGSRGAFSAHLAQAYLCGMLPKGNVTVKELYGYLQRESMGAAAGYWGNGAMA